MSRLNVDQIYTRTGTGSPAIREMPVFSVSMINDQTGIGVQTTTKVAFDTVDYDLGSYWDTTNKRYKPLIPGYYQFNGVLRCIVSGGQTFLSRIHLHKNGSIVVSSYVQLSSTIVNTSHLAVSYLVYCDGTNDYVEMFGWIGTGTATSRAFGGFNDSVGGTSLQGFLVRPD